MIEVRVPEVGESVQEAVLAEWFKADGDRVTRDDPLFLLETDKITLEVVAEASGILRIRVAAGQPVAIGQVVGGIEPADEADGPDPGQAAEPAAERRPEPAPAPDPEPRRPAPEAEPPRPPGAGEGPVLAPSVRRLVAQHGLDPARIPATGPGGRLTKGDVLAFLEAGDATPAGPDPAPDDGVTRTRMSPIRRRIAQRLLQAKNETALLTTFNEVDMSRAVALRRRYKDRFREVHGVGLGYTSLFVRAAAVALAEFPLLNASIDGDEIVRSAAVHMGIAVGSGRGLVVPVVRNAHRLGLGAIEKAVADLVARVRDNRLELADLEGGTFTITNGGVFGSLLSTPILNPPQSGILGLHKVEDRPVAVDGRVEIRPMMYVALSYDHRIVDGREAVQFLVRVKELVEDPDRLLLEV